jgi:prohibitin 1
MLFLLAVLVALVAAYLSVAGRRKVGGVAGAAAGRATGAAAALVAAIAVLVAATQALTVVPAGHVGVVDLFGKVSPETLKAGINLVNPLARVHKFSIKTQEIKEVMEVPSREGLTVSLEISALFHLSPDKAAEVYRTVGPNYVEILLEPQFRSVARGVTAGYDAKALYTSERETLAQTIRQDLETLLEPRGIEIESTPLRKVALPAGLTQAITEKLRAEQESQRMQFVLVKEQQEAERKRIEAKGIADFQDIVSRGISEPLLRWKGIEATERLAGSANAKLVIVGAGRDGLPIILDTK